MHALILGCGFTGSRVAQAMRERGFEVDCSDFSKLIKDTLVLHSIPVPGAAAVLLQNPPRRVVYLSTTGVYGDSAVVDEHTAPAPRTEQAVARIAEEQRVLGGPWTGLVLRPAAIYGPGRGIHAAMRAGKHQLVEDGRNFVSRIHVDDLARLCVAALLSDVTGAYPVADEEPCTSREIAEFCASLLGIALPPSVPREQVPESRRADRRVDGSAVRRALGVKLQYPSYREGIPACLEAEARALVTS